MTQPAQQTDGAPTPSGSVVVGLDGRDEDASALMWAAKEAQARGSALHLITALDLDAPALASGDLLTVAALEDDLGEDAEGILAKARDRIAEVSPQVPVTSAVVAGKAARALLDASEQAAVVVLGSARMGRLERIFIGATSTPVLTTASCPVVVVGPGVPEGDVAVAFDGSAHARVGLDFAVEAAVRYGCGLTVISGWYVEVVDGVVVTTPGTAAYEKVKADYTAAIEEALAPHRAAHPDLPIAIEVGQGPVHKVILAAAQGHRLLVLGSRGRGGIAGTLLGSVSRRVLQSATLPVAVLTSADTPR